MALTQGSGGFRGVLLWGAGVPAAAQIGMIEALEASEGGLHAAVGSGWGALAGAVWACGGDLSYLAGLMGHLPWRRLRREIDGVVRLLTKERTFDALEKPYAVAVCDLADGSARLIREGSVADAVRASLGLPGWLPPVARAGGLLADGALAGALSAAAARELGCNEVWRCVWTLSSTHPLPSEAPAWLAWTAGRRFTPEADVVLQVGPVEGSLLDASSIDAWIESGRRAVLRRLSLPSFE